MGKQYTLIDVDPVSSAREKAAGTFQAPSYGKKATGAARSAATIIDEAGAKKPNRIGGAVQTAIGGAVMAVGVPMLVLPGPGLLAIGGGAALAAGGIKKLLGK
ncbi:hypothetical protein [Arabiibacter massiliensis]|uniref:hypothetical protein n=1 Tax=Arabiibacter massiliensis TaxID=1870985 RepID=UPI0009BC2307|nr:hypothetical protein [Arabiibacter massiliensis]